MEFKDVIETRRSVRKYTEEPVTEETIRKIVETAQYTPTWKNSQSVRVTAVTDPALKARIAEEAIPDYKKNTGIINAAPVLLILSTVKGICGYEPDGSFSTGKGTHWESYDAGAFGYAICLAAREMGLGTCIMGLFDEVKAAELIDLPDGESVSVFIALGYPLFDPKMPPRKPLDEVLRIK